MNVRAAIFILLASCWCSVAGEQTPPRRLVPRVLLLYSNDRLLPANLRFDEGFRATLNEVFGDQYELYTEFLDAVRFPDDERQEAMASGLAVRYRDRRPHVLVAGGPDALRFLQERREALFPGVPLLFGGVRLRDKPDVEIDRDVAGLPMSLEIAPTLEMALGLRPHTREVVVVSGNAQADREWAALARVEFQPFESRIKVTYWSELPFAELLERGSRLPPETVVFFLTYFREPDGTLIPSSAQAVERFADRCSAPVFGPYDTYLGRGIVGGMMTDFTGEGAAVGRLVERIIGGETPQEIGVQSPRSGVFQFDARQLDRWKISRADLPPGSKLHFGRKSVWQEHPRVVAGGVTAVVLQAALIIALMLHRRHVKRTDAALRVSEERYREVVESQTELVCRYRPDTTLTFVNEAYCRAFHRPRENLLGHPFLELIPEGKRAEIESLVQKVITSGAPLLHEHQVLQPDGNIGWMEWQDFPIRDERGEITELQGIGRDVTERRRATEALAESERNLAHATRLALIGELTASIAHEINQPLGAILSNAEAAEMLLDAGSIDEVRRILADIRREDLRASEVIQHVRGLAGKRMPHFAPLDVNECVEMAMQLASSEAHRRGVTLLVDLARDLPVIEGERVQIEQVLLNLILNGMDAMNDIKPAHRRLTVRSRLEPGQAVEISVTDAGHGIPEQELPRIFESFFTTKEMGMGLGLAMARSIAEAHCGLISAENNAEGGASFRLRLPVNGHRIR